MIGLRLARRAAWGLEGQRDRAGNPCIACILARANSTYLLEYHGVCEGSRLAIFHVMFSSPLLKEILVCGPRRNLQSLLVVKIGWGWSYKMTFLFALFSKIPNLHLY